MFYLRLFSLYVVIPILFFPGGVTSCNFGSRGEKEEPEIAMDTLEVTASAYNSLSWQTTGINPDITAWGDTLKPGMKVIAVSRDLLQKGLEYNTPVKIEGFRGEFLVKDKMHPRWQNKIDIYMGVDVQRAREWGRKKVKIFYPSPSNSKDTL